MSRIGRKEIAVPAGVTIKYEDQVLYVKGPKGELTQSVASDKITVSLEGAVARVGRLSEQKEVRAMHGLYRMLLANMVEGVTKGFTKALTIQGVGYKAQKVSSQKITLQVGYSHTVDFEAPEGVTLDCPTATEVTVTGISKEKVGQTAANIRAIKKPEPYHCYGIRYKDEVIVKKEGKTAGK